ncbi:hypothetical protein AHF37_09402 [Paragonimus kellicotti]|nr:hypothetical protein AHF37_09402 [Paragonimus kellicotti]
MRDAPVSGAHASKRSAVRGAYLCILCVPVLLLSVCLEQNDALRDAQNGRNTRYSQPVTHASTNRAQRCLTSVIGREPVFPTWYGRGQPPRHAHCIQTEPKRNETKRNEPNRTEPNRAARSALPRAPNSHKQTLAQTPEPSQTLQTLN